MRNHNLISSNKTIILVAAIIIVNTVIFIDPLLAQILPLNRLITWAPGVPGGIPNRTKICAKLSPSGKDDAPQINSAIASCPADQVISFSSGTFIINSTFSINKGITLRGAGPSSTIFYETGTPSGYQLILMGLLSNIPSTISNPINVTAGYTRGSTVLTLADASSINVGDFLQIDQLNDNATTTVTNTGNGGTCTWCNDLDGSGDGTRALGQMIKVTGKNGNDITIEKGLYWNYVASANPQVRKFSMVESAGIENIMFTQPLTYPVPHLLRMSHCAKCWVKNVEIKYGKNRHLEIRYSYRYEIRDSYFHIAKSYGQDYGYCVSLWDGATDGLIENNIMDTCVSAVQFSGPASGNVIAYNYSYNVSYTIDPNFMEPDFPTHGAHPYFNLFEGNIGYAAYHDNRFGSSSHNVWLRNRLLGYEPGKNSYLHAATVDANNSYMSFIGNILGSPNIVPAYVRYETVNYSGSCYSNAPDIYRFGYDAGAGDCDANGNDPLPYNTVLRHGNYDYYNNKVMWDPSIADHAIPNSYYLTSKPAFFGNLPWPPIRPELTSPVTGTLPAEIRFHAPVASTLTPH